MRHSEIDLYGKKPDENKTSCIVQKNRFQNTQDLLENVNCAKVINDYFRETLSDLFVNKFLVH